MLVVAQHAAMFTLARDWIRKRLLCLPACIAQSSPPTVFRMCTTNLPSSAITARVKDIVTASPYSSSHNAARAAIVAPTHLARRGGR